MRTSDFVFYGSWADAIGDLPKGIRMEVLDAVVEYGVRGTVPELKSVARMAFGFIKADIDRQRARQGEISKTRSDASRQRWQKSKTEVAESSPPGDANAYFAYANDANAYLHKTGEKAVGLNPASGVVLSGVDANDANAYDANSEKEKAKEKKRTKRKEKEKEKEKAHTPRESASEQNSFVASPVVTAGESSTLPQASRLRPMKSTAGEPATPRQTATETARYTAGEPPASHHPEPFASVTEPVSVPNQPASRHPSAVADESGGTDGDPLGELPCTVGGYAVLCGLWNEVCGDLLPNVSELPTGWVAKSGNTEVSVPFLANIRLYEPKFRTDADDPSHVLSTPEVVRRYFRRIRCSDFLTGQSRHCSGWVATFEWSIKIENLDKVVEGLYDNKSKRNGKSKSTTAVAGGGGVAVASGDPRFQFAGSAESATVEAKPYSRIQELGYARFSLE